MRIPTLITLVLAILTTAACDQAGPVEDGQGTDIPDLPNVPDFSPSTECELEAVDVLDACLNEDVSCQYGWDIHCHVDYGEALVECGDKPEYSQCLAECYADDTERAAWACHTYDHDVPYGYEPEACVEWCERNP